MKKESGPARWIAAALPIDAVLVAYIEHPTGIRLDRWKLTRHRCNSLSIAAKTIASHSLNDTREVGCSLTALPTHCSESEMGQFSSVARSRAHVRLAANSGHRANRELSPKADMAE